MTDLNLIKDKLSILDVVNTYIKVDKVGTNFRARCPFHNEKSPSFYISEQRQSYHCFGCNEHGDIFSFVMKMEHLEFREALKLLADRAGVTLVNTGTENNTKSFDVLEMAAQYFENNLKNSDRYKEAPLLYMKNRGMTEETIREWRIGFAPNDWRLLTLFLQKNGFAEEEILESGLCIKHEKGLYDRFRSRVMFPIFSSSGKVVAFTGRIIGDESKKEGVAKYVNSPETKLYHKSKILFGYDKAKKYISNEKSVIVVEGQMDCIMSYQAGVKNVVAISGTAFTDDQINLLKRFTDTIIFSQDSDKAGFESMKKSALVALKAELSVYGINIEGGKDPADMVLSDKESWINAVKNYKNIFEIIATKIKKDEPVREKLIKLVYKEIFPLLTQVKSKTLKDEYLKVVSEHLNISENSLSSDFEIQNVSFEPNIIKPVSNTKIRKDLVEHISKLKALIYLLPISHEKELLEKRIDEELSKWASVLDFEIPEPLIQTDIFKLEKEGKTVEMIEVKEALILIIKTIVKEVNEKNKITFANDDSLMLSSYINIDKYLKDNPV